MRIKSRIDETEFDELARPKLKLFLSVDIVGSTNFKQRDKDAQSQGWLNLFVSFFSEFPSLFRSEVSECNPKLELPRLWKSLGDELIFTMELTQRQHAAEYIKTFASTLRQAAKNWHTDLKDPARRELHLKGTAWLAGFPVGNVEIPLRSSENSLRSEGKNSNARDSDEKDYDGRDYIGPLIDTGFRLKEFATSRKLVMSADLAYLILSAGVSGMAFFFDGEHSLKGVLRSKPYPLVWLDCDGHPQTEHITPSAFMNCLKDDLSRCAPVNPENLKTYLKLWLESCRSFLCIPFVYDDKSSDLCPAGDYEERLERAKIDLKALFYVDDGSDAQQTQGDTSIPREATELLNSLAIDLPATGKPGARLVTDSEMVEHETLPWPEITPDTMRHMSMPSNDKNVSFTKVLGKSYYSKGFINIPIDQSKELGPHETRLVFFLGRDNPVTVETKIDRKANLNGSPRLHGGKKVAQWFQDHFREGDTLHATIVSENEIVLETPTRTKRSS